MEKEFYVYILADKPYGTLYIGVTNDVARRVWEHKERVCRGFTRRYRVDKLVYCESYPTAEEAIAREKAMKKWRRDWKIQTIAKQNPKWSDLYMSL